MQLDSKDQVLPGEFCTKPSANGRRRVMALSLFLLSVIGITQFTWGFGSGILTGSTGNDDSLCPITPKIDPTDYMYDFSRIDYILHDKRYQNQVIRRLQDAVNIPTVSTDEMVNPNVTDSLSKLYKMEPLWENFSTFNAFLSKTYPLVFQNLKVDTINKFGILITWKGKDANKKPILLTAHEDVVPVESQTEDQWDMPPFNATVKDGKIYGRGASDCKSLLMGLLETIELLLSEKKFEPERTILVGFGYDEESRGTGADEISKFIMEQYGPDSLYALIDEGNSGHDEIDGKGFILIPTAEKGHLNSIIELYIQGGHSSTPPKHSGIGIMGRLITQIEDNEFNSQLTNLNPLLNQLQCQAIHSPNIAKSLKSDIMKSQFDINANKRLVDVLMKGDETQFLVKTTQALDIIHGGSKSNSLPDYVSLLVNHRIAIEETLDMTSDKIIKDIKKIADQFDLGLTAHGKVIKPATDLGHFNYIADESLSPSPVSPTDNKVWKQFGGSLRYFYEDVLKTSNDSLIVSPAMAGGNTDTKSYWELTKNIYRYQPGYPVTEDNHIHSVNEYASVDNHMAIISFYYYYLQVIDKVRDDDDQ